MTESSSETATTTATSFSKDDIICTDKYLGLASISDKILYLKTDLIHHRLSSIEWRDKVIHVEQKPIWITGHSDYPIDESAFQFYQSNCQCWYTVNKFHLDDKIRALPLGITNNTYESELHPIYGNVDIMIDVMNQPRTIKNLVYLNFSINTFPSERQYCYNLFCNKEWVTHGKIVNTLEGRKSFLEDVKSHKFVLCPRGNGIDTHRLWETLYMGSIPIVVKTIGLDEFTDLPILFIDKWEDVNEEFLIEKYNEIISSSWNMDKLKFSYWRDQILEKSQSL